MRILAASFTAAAVLFSVPLSVNGDEILDLKNQLKAMQAQMHKMQEKLNRLEKQKQKEAQPASHEERITALEDEVAMVGDEQQSIIEDLEKKVHLDLYTTLEFENFQKSDSSFDARSVELVARGQLGSRLNAFSEIEFERTAETSSGSRQGEVELEQGWLEYGVNNAFLPRAGIVLIPFGRYNLNHFDPGNDLTDRPLMTRRIVPTTWSEAGAGFTGSFAAGNWLGSETLEDFDVRYQFYVVNGLTDELDDRGLRSARGAFGSDNNNNKAVVGRVEFSPFDSQEIAFSGYRGSYDRAGNSITGYDVDLHLAAAGFEFKGETAFFNLDDGFEKDSSTAVPEYLRGGYAELGYHFWFDFLNDTFLGRGFDSPTFTLVTRYGWADVDDDGDPGTGANKERRWTFGLNYRPVESWVLKFEYQLNSSDNEPLERGDSNGFISSVSGVF